jgi:hypothetical protein
MFFLYSSTDLIKFFFTQSLKSFETKIFQFISILRVKNRHIINVLKKPKEENFLEYNKYYSDYIQKRFENSL